MKFEDEIGRAIELMAEEQHTDAETLFYEIIGMIKAELSHDTHNRELLHQWAICLSCMDEYEQALLKYERIVSIDVHDKDAWFQICSLLLTLERPQEAEHILEEKLIPLDPENEEYKEALATAKLTLKIERGDINLDAEIQDDRT
ncbi:MAG: tetratricopeptide repeat protein [Fibrobacterales bacterium]